MRPLSPKVDQRCAAAQAGEGIAAKMSAEQMTSLMQRKARTGREAYAERAMTLGRALRLTAAKQADQLMGMAMNALGVTRRTIGGRDQRRVGRLRTDVADGRAE
jgi:hypothetical protein